MNLHLRHEWYFARLCRRAPPARTTYYLVDAPPAHPLCHTISYCQNHFILSNRAAGPPTCPPWRRRRGRPSGSRGPGKGAPPGGRNLRLMCRFAFSANFHCCVLDFGALILVFWCPDSCASAENGWIARTVAQYTRNMVCYNFLRKVRARWREEGEQEGEQEREREGERRGES